MSPKGAVGRVSQLLHYDVAQLLPSSGCVVEDKAFANPLKQEQKTFVNARGRDLYDKQDFPFRSTQPF